MVIMETVYALVGCQQNHSPATNQRNAMQATVTSTNAKYDEWKSVVESYGAYDDSVITDTDWNAQFSRSGTMRSTAFEQKQEGDDSFYRVTLEPGDIGSAWTDVEKGRERAEVSGKKLDKRKKYRFSFSARIQEGMTGYETFFQIHQATSKQCDVGPLIMIFYKSGHLNMAKRGSVPNVSETYGQWRNYSFEVDFASGETSNWKVDGRRVGVDYAAQLAPCGVPYVKFGLYRRTGSEHKSVIDFDNVMIERLN